MERPAFFQFACAGRGGPQKHECNQHGDCRFGSGLAPDCSSQRSSSPAVSAVLGASWQAGAQIDRAMPLKAFWKPIQNHFKRHHHAGRPVPQHRRRASLWPGACRCRPSRRPTASVWVSGAQRRHLSSPAHAVHTQSPRLSAPYPLSQPRLSPGPSPAAQGAWQGCKSPRNQRCLARCSLPKAAAAGPLA